MYCFLYPYILDIVRSAFISAVIGSGLRSDSGTVLLMKMIVSISTVLLPTILMGGTLPVLVKFISRRIEESGKNVAVLYFLNSFGAVVGSVLGGFFMVRIVGLQATIFSAASLDLIVGLSSLALLRIVHKIPAFDISEAKSEVSYPSYIFTNSQIRVAVLIAGLSGLAAMIYEVAWVRMLIPVLGSSTYSFSLMLVAFISGITAGSWLFSVIHRKIRNLFGFLVICQLGIVLAMVVTLPLYGRIPYYFWHTANILSRSDVTYPIYLSIQFSFGFIIMFIPTLFMGMTLPVASRIASRDIKVLGSSVGNVFSVNTIGTVIGSLAAGLLLIPAIGVKSSIEVAIMINLLCGLVILYYDSIRRRIPKTMYGSVAIAAVTIYYLAAPNWNYSINLTSVFRHINRNVEIPSSYAHFQSQLIPREIHYYKEGASATVAVVGSEKNESILIVNGKPDASSSGDMPTQVLLGQIPMFLNPDALDVAVIGFGSGVTIGSVLTHDVRSVDAIEISPEVIEASKHFESVNNKPLDDPRTNLYIDDALSFFKLSNKEYDVIISEPSNPWIAGIGNLYTIEFFELVKGRLRDGGLMVQWFHTYEMNDQTLQLVLRTFVSVFPYVSVWQTLGTDIVIVGSNENVQPDFQKMRNKFQGQSIADDLNRIDIYDTATLLSTQIMTQVEIKDYTGEGVVNTENIPFLEYWAPRAFFINEGVRNYFQLDTRMHFTSNELYLNEYIEENGLLPEQQLNVAVYHAVLQRGNRMFGASLLLNYYESNPDDTKALDHLISVSQRMGRGDEALRYLEILHKRIPDDHSILARLAWKKFEIAKSKLNPLLDIDGSTYISMLNDASRMVQDTIDLYHAQIGDVYFYLNDYLNAHTYYRKSLEARSRYGSNGNIREDVLLVQIARSLYNIGRFQEAFQYAIQAIFANHRNTAAVELGHKIGMRLREDEKVNEPDGLISHKKEEKDYE
jgi:spermidine synthase